MLRSGPRSVRQCLASSAPCSSGQPYTRASRQAQPNDKLGAGSGIALRPDLSPERLHELPADCQPQPCPTVLARGRGADLTELVEDRLELVGGDAGAAVGDDALRPAVREPPAKLHACALGRELDRVA